jgi:hypothetical protein
VSVGVCVFVCVCVNVSGGGRDEMTQSNFNMSTNLAVLIDA